MPRGRPKRDQEDEKVYKTKKLPPQHEQIGEIIEKEEEIDTTKKRGRKRQVSDALMKPEDVLNYIDRNYPKLGISKIKEDILNGLKNRDQNAEHVYVLDEIKIANEIYYCDPDGNILNDDARICGFVVGSDSDNSGDEKANNTHKTYKKAHTQDKKKLRVQMFYADTDDRTYKQIMDSIRFDPKNNSV